MQMPASTQVPLPPPHPTPPPTQALVSMRENFEEINRLCAECQSLIDCHDKIAVLSEVHHNLRKTLLVSERVAGRAGGAVGS